MLNYTKTDAGPGDIVIGSQWPAEGYLTVSLTRTGGWPAGTADRTWKLHVSVDRLGGAPDMSLTASAAVVTDTVLALTFQATPAQTAALAAGRNYVEIEAEEGSNTQYYPTAAGTAQVRYPASEAAA